MSWRRSVSARCGKKPAKGQGVWLLQIFRRESLRILLEEMLKNQSSLDMNCLTLDLLFLLNSKARLCSLIIKTHHSRQANIKIVRQWTKPLLRNCLERSRKIRTTAKTRTTIAKAQIFFKNLPKRKTWSEHWRGVYLTLRATSTQMLGGNQPQCCSRQSVLWARHPFVFGILSASTVEHLEKVKWFVKDTLQDSAIWLTK